MYMYMYLYIYMYTVYPRVPPMLIPNAKACLANNDYCNTWLPLIGCCDILDNWGVIVGEEPAIFSKETERFLAACNRGVFLGCNKRPLREYNCSTSVAATTGVELYLTLFISSLLIYNESHKYYN